MSLCQVADLVVVAMQVQLSWPGLPVNGSNACSGDVVWPILDGIVILGASQPLSTSFTLQVCIATLAPAQLLLNEEVACRTCWLYVSGDPPQHEILVTDNVISCIFGKIFDASSTVADLNIRGAFSV